MLSRVITDLQNQVKKMRKIQVFQGHFSRFQLCESI
jgi:hypothetical protein